MKNLILAACAAVLSLFAFAEIGVPKEMKCSNGTTFRYRLVEKADPEGKKVPLVIWMHGAGERGTNNTRQVCHTAPNITWWLDNREKCGYKFIAGQVPDPLWWTDFRLGAKTVTFSEKPTETMQGMLELLDRMLSDPSIDRDRVYLVGISMGGYAIWDMLARRPGVFAAALPVCGGADLAKAPEIAKTPVWTGHNDGDNVVPVELTRSIVAELRKLGADIRYDEYKKVGHDSWTQFLSIDGEPNHFRWLFSQRRKAK